MLKGLFVMGRKINIGSIEMHGRHYRARWTINGVHYARSTGTADKAEARKRLAEFVAPFLLGRERETLSAIAERVRGVDAEIERIERGRPALALADGFAAWRRSGSRSDPGERTLRDYEGYYRAFCAWVGARHPEILELRGISPDLAREYAEALAESRSAGSYNKHIGFLRLLWQSIIECELEGGRPGALPARIGGNPWERIRPRRGESHRRRELSVDELARVCGALSGEMRTLFAVGIYTGLRLGDCALLDWSCVDLARGVIQIVPHKTARHAHGAPVVIPIHPTLAAILARTPETQRNGAVLPETAARYRRDSSRRAKMIRRIFESCGISTRAKREPGKRAATDVGFHSLRHTFVSLSANAGVPLALVQSIVGHSSSAMTRHYFHASENALRNAVAALPDVGEVGGTTRGKPPERVERNLGEIRALLEGLGAADLRSLIAEAANRLKAVEGGWKR